MPEFQMNAEPLKVVCKQRPNGSAWVSVGDPMEGPHFQCDFLGDVDVGPRRLSDFAAKPPAWVKHRLGFA